VSVLAGVDLVVEGGECVALLGANGAGKTTLLRVLATLLRPSGGALKLFGEDATLRSPAVLRKIGYVGHESACYGDLTARENLAFYAELYGVEDAAARVDELVEWTEPRHGRAPAGADVLARHDAAARARACAAPSPELLLLDEPFSGLDPQATATLEALLIDLRQSGHAIVLSTHDVPRAAALASRVVMLHRGRIDWDGSGGQAAGVAIAARFEELVVKRA
jgi:heme exporter protein A